jgi:hypothetical protein
MATDELLETARGVLSGGDEVVSMVDEVVVPRTKRLVTSDPMVYGEMVSSRNFRHSLKALLSKN